MIFKINRTSFKWRRTAYSEIEKNSTRINTLLLNTVWATAESYASRFAFNYIRRFRHEYNLRNWQLLDS